MKTLVAETSGMDLSSWEVLQQFHLDSYLPDREKLFQRLSTNILTFIPIERKSASCTLFRKLRSTSTPRVELI
jgi:hypothetical protein